MCDFHSAIINHKCEIFHLPSNSHSEIRRVYRLPEIKSNTLRQGTWELEYDARVPGSSRNVRTVVNPPPSNVQSAIDNYFDELASIMRNGVLPNSNWAQPNYADVHMELIRKFGKKLPNTTVMRLYKNASTSVKAKLSAVGFNRTGARTAKISWRSPTPAVAYKLLTKNMSDKMAYDYVRNYSQVCSKGLKAIIASNKVSPAVRDRAVSKLRRDFPKVYSTFANRLVSAAVSMPSLRFVRNAALA